MHSARTKSSEVLQATATAPLRMVAGLGLSYIAALGTASTCSMIYRISWSDVKNTVESGGYSDFDRSCPHQAYQYAQW